MNKIVAAGDLHQWFNQVADLIRETESGISPEGPHRDAVVLNILTRSARQLLESELDREGALYKPICLFLATPCQRLGIDLGRGHWESAVTNVVALHGQIARLRTASAGVGLDIASPVRLFKEQMDEALKNAGVAGVPTFVDVEGRRIALGLAINWGMRLLCVYALESEVPVHPGRHDLGWIREQLRSTAPKAGDTTAIAGSS